MTLDDLQVGDRIKYTVLRDRGRKYERQGEIVQITKKFITVNIGRYQETINITDINPEKPGVGSILMPYLNGIPALIKQTEMQAQLEKDWGKKEVEGVANSKETRIDWELKWPKAQELIAEGQSMSQVATLLGIDRKALSCKVDREMRKANKKLLSEINAVAAEPIQIESNDLPEGGNSSELKIVQPGALQNEGTIIADNLRRVAGEPINPIINYGDVYSPSVTAPIFKQAPSTLVYDDTPMPVSLEQLTDIASLKFEMIELIVNKVKLRNFPKRDALNLIGQINLMELPEVS